nr:hypothetical protein [Tanacetum cinerariifolium]
MHQFWHTITKSKTSSSYKFKLDKKKCTIDVEVFCDILQICPRLPNQEFDAPHSDAEIVTFIKELGHNGDIIPITKVHDSILGTLIFVSKSDEYQVYGALLPEGMTNQQMRDSPTYKTYLSFATGAATPRKRNLSKKHAVRRQSVGVQIRDTPGVSVSKKKALAKTDRSKEIELLSEAALLDEAQLKRLSKESNKK